LLSEVEDPRRLVFGGRKGSLYVLSGAEITKLDRYGRVNERIRPDYPVEALAFDEKNQRLIGISREAVLLFDTELRLIGVYEIEADVAGYGTRVSASVNPLSGQVGIFYAGASYYTLFDLEADGIFRKEQVSLPRDVRYAEAFYIDKRGAAYVSDHGHIIVFNSSGDLLESSPFAALPAGQSLLITRSYSNFDPNTMNNRAFRNR
jgi:hypothetical protein